MKTYRRITGIAVMLAALVLIASCSEDEEILKEDQLIGSWELESQKVTNIKASFNGFELNIPEELLEGYVDSLAIFPEDGSITFNQNRTYSVATSSQSGALSGSWELSDDGKAITIAGLDDAAQFLGSSSLTFVIQSFTDTNLSLLASIPDITIPENIDIPGVPDIGGASFSGDYQLDLKKQQ